MWNTWKSLPLGVKLSLIWFPILLFILGLAFHWAVPVIIICLVFSAVAFDRLVGYGVTGK